MIGIPLIHVAGLPSGEEQHCARCGILISDHISQTNRGYAVGHEVVIGYEDGYRFTGDLTHRARLNGHPSDERIAEAKECIE